MRSLHVLVNRFHQLKIYKSNNTTFTSRRVAPRTLLHAAQPAALWEKAVLMGFVKPAVRMKPFAGIPAAPRDTIAAKGSANNASSAKLLVEHNAAAKQHR